MRIGIVGTGTMGQGIARLLTTSGFETVVCGRSSMSNESFSNALVQWLERQLVKEKLSTHEAEASAKRLTVTQEMNALGEVDFVIEAVVETLEIKRDVFAHLEATCSDRVPLASNTSSIPIEQISREMKTRGRVIGVHFMNPPYVMPLVEVIPSAWTNADVLDATLQFLADLEKEVLVVPDIPGFVLNRILFSSIHQAIQLVETGKADGTTIDAVMKLGVSHPMGPLELADFIGLDVCMAILENLSRMEPTRFAPPTLLREKIAKGKLGRKTGEGFHRYDSR